MTKNCLLEGLAVIGFAAGISLLAASCDSAEALVVVDQYKTGDLTEMRYWKDLPKGEAEAKTEHHRLVGLGCGLDHKTYTAEEEDHFPYPCYAIDTPERMCATEDLSYIPTVVECAIYMGDGW